MNLFRMCAFLIILSAIGACTTTRPTPVTSEDPLLRQHMVERDLSNSLVIINPEVNKK